VGLEDRGKGIRVGYLLSRCGQREPSVIPAHLRLHTPTTSPHRSPTQARRCGEMLSDKPIRDSGLTCSMRKARVERQVEARTASEAASLSQ
jgi:hypothetical protein